MNRITIIAVGTIKDLSFQALINSYQKKISPYAIIELIETKALAFNRSNMKQVKGQERQALMRLLHRFRKEQIYLLDERGLSFNSLDWAQLLKRNESNHLVLVIAGSLGWDESWGQDYQRLSLSALTFPHELARVVLLEQIYRGLTINIGKQYHY